MTTLFHILSLLISSIQKENKVVLLENAKETRRTFLNNHDSCMAVIKLLKNEDSLDGEIYNAGTKEEIYIIDLVKLISKLMNKTDGVIEFKGMRTADPPRRLLNSSKLEHHVNWALEVSLEQGVKECIKKRLNREY
jgi:nucleoside-diphosphate-sugar epimerase